MKSHKNQDWKVNTNSSPRGNWSVLKQTNEFREEAHMENEQYFYRYSLDCSLCLDCSDEDEAEELAREEGLDSYWEFKCAPFDAGEVFKVENLLEDIDSKLYEDIQECNEVGAFRNVTDAEKKDLDDFVRAWLKKHARVNFFKIVEYKEIFLKSTD